MEPPLRWREVGRAWNRFFHEPADPRIVGLLRMLYGTLALAYFGLMAPHVEFFWGEEGILPFDVSRTIIDPDAWTVFTWLPRTHAVLWACYGLALTHCVLLAVGLGSRFQAIGVFFWMISFQHRNNMIIDGEDIVFRLFAFFLVFMPLSQRFSVDAVLRRKFGRPEPTASSGWALRMLQIQMCLILWSAGLEKLGGADWWSGDAMYYVTQLDDLYGHWPVPDFVSQSLWLLRIATWTALLVELLAPVFVWFEETRRAALLVIVLLHFAMEYMMNLFLFEWIMIVGWASHARWEELVWIRNRILPFRARPYD